MTCNCGQSHFPRRNAQSGHIFDIFRLKSDTDKVVLVLTLMRPSRCVIVVG